MRRHGATQVLAAGLGLLRSVDFLAAQQELDPAVCWLEAWCSVSRIQPKLAAALQQTRALESLEASLTGPGEAACRSCIRHILQGRTCREAVDPGLLDRCRAAVDL